MVIIIILVIVELVLSTKNLSSLEKNQSALCPSVVCAYDGSNKCNGYSYRNVGDGFYCSNTPTTFYKNSQTN